MRSMNRANLLLTTLQQVKPTRLTAVLEPPVGPLRQSKRLSMVGALPRPWSRSEPFSSGLPRMTSNCREYLHGVRQGSKEAE